MRTSLLCFLAAVAVSYCMKCAAAQPDPGDFAAPILAGPPSKPVLGQIVYRSEINSLAIYGKEGWLSLMTSSLEGIPNARFVYLGNGHGTSTGFSNIRWFLSNSISGDNSIDFFQNTFGTILTVKEPGLYHVQYLDRRVTPGGFQIGLTVNESSTDVSGPIQSVSAEHILAYARAATTPAVAYCAATVWLKKGDVLRAHDDGNADGDFSGVDTAYVKITRLGN